MGIINNFSRLKQNLVREESAKKPKSRGMGKVHIVGRPVRFLIVVYDVEPQAGVVRSSHHRRQVAQPCKVFYPLDLLRVVFSVQIQVYYPSPRWFFKHLLKTF